MSQTKRWWRKLLDGSHRLSGRRARARLQIESLEERITPAVFTLDPADLSGSASATVNIRLNQNTYSSFGTNASVSTPYSVVTANASASQYLSEGPELSLAVSGNSVGDGPAAVYTSANAFAGGLLSGRIDPAAGDTIGAPTTLRISIKGLADFAGKNADRGVLPQGYTSLYVSFDGGQNFTSLLTPSFFQFDDKSIINSSFVVAASIGSPVAIRASVGGFTSFSSEYQEFAVSVDLDIETLPDLTADALEWDATGSTVKYAFSSSGTDLPTSTTAALYWARGETFDKVIGDPIPGTTHTLDAGSAPRAYGPFSVSVDALGAPPDGATHLLAVVDPPAEGAPKGNIIELNEANNVRALELPRGDISPTSLSWNVESGGVSLSYTNSNDLPAPAPSKSYTYSLYWSNGADGKTKIGGAVATGALLTSKGLHALSVPAGQLGTPPSIATHLLLEVDSGQALTEPVAGEGSANLLPLVFAPAIDTFTAKYDGTDPGDEYFGRFFTGVDVFGQVAYFHLSASLAALNPNVVFAVGEAVLPWTSQIDGNGRAYVTGDFNPGALTADTPATVTVYYADGSVAFFRTITIDVEALPAWYEQLSPRGVSVSYFPDPYLPTQGRLKYEFEGQLLDLATPAVFDIPDAIWLGGLADLKSALIAKLGMKVIADLDPTTKPEVSGSLDVAATFLGKDLFVPIHEVYPSGVPGPLQFTLALNPRSLAIETGTIRYNPDAKTLPAIPLFDGQVFQVGGVQAKGALSLTPSYDLDITLVFSAGGLTAGSYADIVLTGALTGSLTISDNLVAFLLGSSPGAELVQRALQVAKKLSLQGLIATAVGALVPDLLQVKLNTTPGSALSLHTRIALGPGGPKVESRTGRITFAVTGDVYFAPTGTKLVAGLPNGLTDPFKLDKTFP